MKGVFAANIGITRFGKRDESITGLVKETLDDLLKYDPNFEPDLDAIFCGSMNPEQFIHSGNISSIIADYLGLNPLPSVRIETASSTGASVFQMGAIAVASGHYKNVLVIAAEKMTGLDTADTTSALASVISENERRYGATMPALAALITNRYMHDHKLTREILSKVAVKNHHNGSLNPVAHFQKEISIEKASESRFVAEPLRLYDCSPISDGAAAVILTGKKTDVAITGMGHATDSMELRFRKSLTSFGSTRMAASKAFSDAGIKPDRIDIAELHDAFTPFELISAEDVGFFEPGGSVKAIESGETELSGKIPINTSGGLKARGHPVGVSGLAQIIELILQLRGQANSRQIENVSSALAQSTGGIANNNLVTILEKA